MHCDTLLKLGGFEEKWVLEKNSVVKEYLATAADGKRHVTFVFKDISAATEHTLYKPISEPKQTLAY